MTDSIAQMANERMSLIKDEKASKALEEFAKALKRAKGGDAEATSKASQFMFLSGNEDIFEELFSKDENAAESAIEEIARLWAAFAPGAFENVEEEGYTQLAIKMEKAGLSDMILEALNGKSAFDIIAERTYSNIDMTIEELVMCESEMR